MPAQNRAALPKGILMSTSPVRRKVLWGLAIAALIGVGITSILFSSWSEWTPSEAVDAQAAFEEALAACGAGPAYIEISEAGEVLVRRELEQPTALELDALVLLAWDPERQRLLRVRFPYWFVRVKLNRTFNLGTLITVMAKDWEHVDLSVTEDDLERRGPGLILDRALESGARWMLWTE